MRHDSWGGGKGVRWWGGGARSGCAYSRRRTRASLSGLAGSTKKAVTEALRAVVPRAIKSWGREREEG